MQSGDYMDSRRLMAMVNSLASGQQFKQPDYDYNAQGWGTLMGRYGAQQRAQQQMAMNNFGDTYAASDPKLKTGKRKVNHKQMLAKALRSHC